jgi:adenosylcobinamide-GDP ribazoletransferase
MLRFIRHYLLAVQFFTRIPITGALARWVGFSPVMLRASAAHFPGVGWLVAGVACGVYAGLAWGLQQHVLAPWVAAAGSTVATVLLTGGFHEDGLADVADGLGGSVERARALEIMKDSRVGAFGAMALCLALICKVCLLALLGTHSLQAALLALLAGHVWSRYLPLLTVAWLPHVGDAAGSKSKPLADQISRRALVVALIWCFMLLPHHLIAQAAIILVAAVALSAVAWLYMHRLFARRLGGFTGDCLGATQQVCEVACYLGVALAL